MVGGLGLYFYFLFDLLWHAYYVTQEFLWTRVIKMWYVHMIATCGLFSTNTMACPRIW